MSSLILSEDFYSTISKRNTLSVRTLNSSHYSTQAYCSPETRLQCRTQNLHPERYCKDPSSVPGSVCTAQSGRLTKAFRQINSARVSFFLPKTSAVSMALWLFKTCVKHFLAIRSSPQAEPLGWHPLSSAKSAKSSIWKKNTFRLLRSTIS